MNEINKNVIILIVAVGMFTLIGAVLISQVSLNISAAIIAGILLAVICFVNSEFALYILIIAMLLGPQFAVGGSAELEATRGRSLTLRVDDLLLLIIGASWFAKSAVKKELGLFLKTPLNRPIAWYAIACLISTTFGFMMGRIKFASGFFFLLKYFEYYIVFFMAVNHLKDRKQIERLTLTLLVVCFIVCIIGLVQIPAGGRISAPFEGPEGEPNTLGGYLILMLSITLGLLLTGGLSKYKLFFFTLSGFILLTLAGTLSRSSWIALFPMAATLFIFTKRKMVFIIPILILLILTPFYLPKSVKERALFTVTQKPEFGQLKVGGVRVDTSTSARIQSWKNVLLKDFYKNAFLGYGVTGYPFLDAQYPRVLAETGILGFTVFLILLFSLFKYGYLAYRQTTDPLYSGIALGYLAGFMAMLIHAIGANTFIIVRIMEPFWFLTAIIIMIPTIEKGESEQGGSAEVLASRPAASKRLPWATPMPLPRS